MFPPRPSLVDVLTAYEMGRRRFVGVNLSFADLSARDLRGVDFSEGILVGVTLQGANLAGAKFKRANLSGANLRQTNLTGAVFEQADLVRADLTGSSGPISAGRICGRLTSRGRCLNRRIWCARI